MTLEVTLYFIGVTSVKNCNETQMQLTAAMHCRLYKQRTEAVNEPQSLRVAAKKRHVIHLLKVSHEVTLLAITLPKCAAK